MVFLQKFYKLNLERLPWVGCAALSLSLIPSMIWLIPPAKKWVCPPAASIPGAPAFSLDVDLELRSEFRPISVSEAASQISFSIDPPRPSMDPTHSRLMVRLNQSKQAQRVEIPARVELEFSDDGVLHFAQGKSLFWLEIEESSPLEEREASFAKGRQDHGRSLTDGSASLAANGRDCGRATVQQNAMNAQASLCFLEPTANKEQVFTWSVIAQDTPIQMAEEFASGTPFRELVESRWLGQDLFAELYGSGERIYRLDVGPIGHSHILDLSQGNWIAYRQGAWNRIEDLEGLSNEPIARIREINARCIELEGWDGLSHVRFQLTQFPLSPLKTKGEEIFSQLRVRSEKQISCSLDKQWLILRPGDWILKMDQRWRILRKQEEKDSLLSGELFGEVFVLDRIDAKGATKSIAGHFFNPARTQKAVIEYQAPTSRGTSSKSGSLKAADSQLQKMRGRAK